MTTREMVLFDWALEHQLRDKANFEVLEGFLSELLRRKIIIRHLVESENNPTAVYNNTTRMILLVEVDGSELVVIELQFEGEYDFYVRTFHGDNTSISKGYPYSEVQKVYSINIVLFDLGEGDDYIYHGVTDFTGLHVRDKLQLSARLQQFFNKTCPCDLHLEYYIIKINEFDEVLENTLDEWMFYLKKNKIRDCFTAQGMDKACKVLAYYDLTDDEKRWYNNSIENRRINDSVMNTALTNGYAEGLKKAKAKLEAVQAEKDAAQAEKRCCPGTVRSTDCRITAAIG